MTALPSTASFTGGAVTEAGFKTAMTDLRAFLAGIIGTAGTQEEALLILGAFLGAGVADKSGACTVVATDRGKLFNCTGGTFTISLTAAATLGGGFSFAVRNSGSGVITLDPNGSETINGATSIALAAGVSCIVICNGTSFVTVGLVANYATSAGSAPASDVYPWAKAASPPATGVPLDVGNLGVGCFIFGQLNGAVTGYINVGSSLAGSAVNCAQQWLDSTSNSTYSPPGTYRVLPCPAGYATPILQRIA